MYLAFYKRFFASVLTVAASATISSCSPPSGHDAAQQGSSLHYITVGRNTSGLVGQVKKPEIKVCLTGAFSVDEEKIKENITSVILKWVEPMRVLTSVPLASSVAFVGSGGSCEVTVQIIPGVWANTSTGNWPTVRVDNKGYFGSYGVLFHEFGHAFALSDTYRPGASSGNCKAGQPQSIMCNMSFRELQADDIAGVVAIFKRTYPNDVPGGPISTTPTDLAGKIYARLSPVATSDGYDFYMSFASNSQVNTLNNGIMAYCVGSKAACNTGGSWIDTESVSNVSGVSIFKGKTPLSLVTGTNVTMRYYVGSQSIYQEIVIKKK